MRSPLGSRALRLAAAIALLTSALAGSPAAAFAARYSTDRVAGVPLSAGRVPYSSAPDVAARSGALVGPGGRTLWTRKAEVRRAMASTTKVMTAIVVLEQCRLDETVRVSRAAARTPYRLGLKTGERRSVRKLLELTLVASSNDAASALAIHTAGSVSGFAKLMNAKAAQLGLANTRFANPHGLDSKGHYSSANDMNRIMRAALAQPEFRRIIAMRSVFLPAYKTRPARRIKATDKLLGVVDGMAGGKTGFTNDARYCFVGTARRDGLTLTASVLSAPSSSERFTAARRLLEWGFRHYRYRTLCAPTQSAGTVAASTNPSRTVSARYAATARLPVLDVLGPVGRERSLQASVTVPVFAGQSLGTVRFVQAGAVLATVQAIAAAPMASAEETVGVVRIEGSADVVVAKAAPTTAWVAPYDTSRPIERVVDLPENVAAPPAPGEVLGAITYSQDGRVLVTVPAVAAEVSDG